MEGYKAPEQSKTPEASILTDREKITEALTRLGNDPLSMYTAIVSPMPYPQESFLRWIDDFNTFPAEERGLNAYDHSRSLTEHVDISVDMRIPSGYPLTATLHKNGEMTLSSTLSLAA